MPDDDDTQIDPEDKKPTARDLRNQLETALASNRDLQHRLLVHEAGLNTLSARQVNAVLRSFDDGEKVDKDTVKAMALDLGFISNDPPPGSPPPDPNASTDTPPEVDPEVAQSITGLSKQEEALIIARRGGGTRIAVEEFTKKLNEAKSQDEATAIIQQYGAGVGLVHEYDIS